MTKARTTRNIRSFPSTFRLRRHVEEYFVNLGGDSEPFPAVFTNHEMNSTLGGAVHAYVAEVEPPRKYVVVVDSGATEHCFWRREDFSEYHPIESREGNAA